VVAQLSTHNGVGIANYNSPRQIAISGELESLTLAATMLTARGGRVVRLNVSGPWHSPLLADASERFVEVLRAVAFHPARVPVVLNVSGAAATDAVAIRSAMERQLCATVRWAQTLLTLHQQGVRHFFEVGPGRVLRGLLRGVPEVSSSAVTNVEGPKSLRFLASAPLPKESAA